MSWMAEREKAYRLLEKLAEQTDYVIVHPREIRMLLTDLKNLRDRVDVARGQLIEMTKDMA